MVDEASGHPEQSGPDGASAYQAGGRLGFPEDGYLPVEVVGQGGAEQPDGVRGEDTGW